MRRKSQELAIDYCHSDGNYYSIKADVFPSIPGKYYGLPEDCYPDEDAEVEIKSIKFEGEEVEHWDAIFDEKDYEIIYENFVRLSEDNDDREIASDIDDEDDDADRCFCNICRRDDDY